jgi:hypothetical protein
MTDTDLIGRRFRPRGSRATYIVESISQRQGYVVAVNPKMPVRFEESQG